MYRITGGMSSITPESKEMASKREEVLQALHARLQSVPLVKVERNRFAPSGSRPRA